MSDESIGKLNPPPHTQTHTHTQKHVTASHSWTSAHNLIPCHCSPGMHSSALKTVIKHWFIPFKRNRNYVEKVFEKGSVLFIVKWKWWEGLLKERFITKQTCTCNFSAESEGTNWFCEQLPIITRVSLSPSNMSLMLQHHLVETLIGIFP